MENSYFGSCLCGQVKFKVDGSFQSFYLCHCRFCQKDTGSAHGANLFSATARLHWMSGSGQVKTFNLPATRHTKSFCRDCGAALPSLQDSGELLVVPAGSLDTEMALKPDAHLFYSSRAAWDGGLETIPRFEKSCAHETL